MATLQELQERKALYLAAEARILQSQEYQSGQGGNARRNRRAELSEVRAEIAAIDRQITALQCPRRAYRLVPR